MHQHGQDEPNEGWKARLVEKLKRWGRAGADRADPLLALVAGAVLGVAGIIGWIRGDNLAAATLLVLSVVGLSLLRERSLRLHASGEIDGVREVVATTQAALDAQNHGCPYEVVSAETIWDIVADDGSLAQVKRTKHVRFHQNEVLSLYDWGQAAGTEDEPLYTPGKKVDTFNSEGKRYALISLGRFYSRGEELEFCAERTLRDSFLLDTERVSAQAIDLTARQQLTVLWPERRPPSMVRFATTSALGIRKSDDVTSRVDDKGGRSSLTIEIPSPERRSVATIEWEW